MSEQPPSRRRGRPRYTLEEKANTDVKRKRAKRQEHVSAQRDGHFALVYPSLPSALPPHDGTHSQPQTHIEIGNVAQGRPQNPGDELDLPYHLPPPSPPLAPLPDVNTDESLGELASPLNANNDGSLGETTGLPMPDEDVDPADPASPADGEDPALGVGRGDEAVDKAVDSLASRLTDQLIRFRGCCADSHRYAKAQHDQGPRGHISLGF